MKRWDLELTFNSSTQHLGEASRRSRCADAAIHPCSLLVAAAATADPPASVLLMGSQRAHIRESKR